jgi:hypothetical protein
MSGSGMAPSVAALLEDDCDDLEVGETAAGKAKRKS